MKNTPGRAAIRALALLPLLAASACSDGAPVAPDLQGGGPPRLATVRCIAQVAARTVHCGAAGSAAGDARGVIVGGQGTNVRLTSSPPVYDATTREFSFGVTVQNLTGRPMATTDRITPSPDGVRVFFAQEPILTEGTGAVTVANADGVGTFTTGVQPYYEFSGEALGADQVLTPDETSASLPWVFEVEPSVVSFSFLLLVSTDVPVDDTDVSIHVDGNRMSGPGVVDPGADLVVSNERLRLSLLLTQDSSSLKVEMKDAAGAWVTTTGPRYGDWLYYGTAPTRLATTVEVLVNTPDEVAVRWSFGNHRVHARYGNPEYAYPFERTIWLRRGERGYYTYSRPLAAPTNSFDTEHEVGWGGLYGPGTISTSRESFRTEDIVGDRRFSQDGEVDAVDFRWEVDGLRRSLVPLPGSEIQAPRFSASNYGGAYVHAVGVARSYGAYLYVAPADEAATTRNVCAYAWRNAPFELPEVTEAELAACGPHP